MHYHLKLQSIQWMCKEHQRASKSQTGLFSRCFTHWHSECLFSISAICTYWGFATKKRILCWPPKPCQHATCHACFCAYDIIWFFLGLFTILTIQHGHGTTNGALPKSRQTTSAFPAKLLRRVVLYLGNHHLGIGKASTRCVSNRVCWKVYRKTWGKLTFAEHGLIKQIQKGDKRGVIGHQIQIRVLRQLFMSIKVSRITSNILKSN